MEDSYVILNQLFYPDKISFQMRESHCKLPQKTHTFSKNTQVNLQLLQLFAWLVILEPRACFQAQSLPPRPSGGPQRPQRGVNRLRKGFCSSFSYLVIFNKALSTNTQPVYVRQAQLKQNSVKLLHSICKSYNANGSLPCVKVILPSFGKG